VGIGVGVGAGRQADETETNKHKTSSVYSMRLYGFMIHLLDECRCAGMAPADRYVLKFDAATVALRSVYIEFRRLDGF
jgi:hypothetical protein